MADRVKEKCLVEEKKIIKGSVDHNIKTQAKRKNTKEKLEKERRGQKVLWLHLQER